MSLLAATGRAQDSPLSWAPPALLLARVQRSLSTTPAMPFERERREQIVRIATVAYLDHVVLRLSREAELVPTPPLVAHGLLNTVNTVLRREFEKTDGSSASRAQCEAQHPSGRGTAGRRAASGRFAPLEAMTSWQIAQALIRVDGVRWAEGRFVIDGASSRADVAAPEPLPYGTLERSTTTRVRSLSRAYDPFLTIRKAGSVTRLVQDLTAAPVKQPGVAVG